MTTVWRDGRRHNAAAAPLHIPVWGCLPHIHTTVGTHSPGLRFTQNFSRYRRYFLVVVGVFSFFLVFCRFSSELLCYRSSIFQLWRFRRQRHTGFSPIIILNEADFLFYFLFFSLYISLTQRCTVIILGHTAYIMNAYKTPCVCFSADPTRHTQKLTLTHSHAARWARTLSSGSALRRWDWLGPPKKRKFNEVIYGSRAPSFVGEQLNFFYRNPPESLEHHLICNDSPILLNFNSASNIPLHKKYFTLCLRWCSSEPIYVLAACFSFFFLLLGYICLVAYCTKHCTRIRFIKNIEM